MQIAHGGNILHMDEVPTINYNTILQFSLVEPLKWVHKSF